VSALEQALTAGRAEAEGLMRDTVHLYRPGEDIGFDREELVHFRIPDRDLLPRMDMLKERMADHPGVMRVGATSSIPGVPTWRHNTVPGGRARDESWLLAFYAVDHEWRLTYVNRRAEEIWGRPREDTGPRASTSSPSSGPASP
jgi:hypothetical protein